jgi:hypothetical protein
MIIQKQAKMILTNMMLFKKIRQINRDLIKLKTIMNKKVIKIIKIKIKRYITKKIKLGNNLNNRNIPNF